ncbi:MFS transporter [Bacillus badius]|uniref:MFS permease n=1 Tax=Bacillus badius TaxID=1455 RepID=A0ABR5AW39_BACBA|nr:MFS transporter [Bacillus badius]KIL78971.1 MFS permease [Bacillus badius]MED4715590.1 MFS transporter [Bacillus badius]
MKRQSASFKALWFGEIISEFGGAAGGIINGLLLFELTGSKEWMGVLWLVYFLPSLMFQSISAPFLNYVRKSKLLRTIQLIRAGAYLLPLTASFIGTETGVVLALIVLQGLLGIMQPIYASLSFSLLPDICQEKELTEANALLDGAIRLMSFLAPGATALLLLVSPAHFIYGLSAAMYLISFFALSRMSETHEQEAVIWTREFWWSEMKEGYRSFFQYPRLLRLSVLSSAVQFAVGAAMVLAVPFIREELNGQPWEYAIFSGAFPVGYAIGSLLLTKLKKTDWMMYLGLTGGGLSFVLLAFAPSTFAASICELLGGVLFPFFNAQSAAIFQQEAPRDRLAQLSAVRLLFLRAAMPLGILFASSSFFGLPIRQVYVAVGLVIVLPGLFYVVLSLLHTRKSLPKNSGREIN